MRKRRLYRILVILIVFVNPYLSRSQDFSFACNRDTTISGCALDPCFTLRALVPDIHASSSNYEVNPIVQNGNACVPQYLAPETFGTPTNLVQDDTYSALIPIGFPFSFFGVNYTNLVVGSNGTVCFDPTRAGQAAHYGIMNSGGVLGETGIPEDLPSTLYDAAQIMGAYHDLDITLNSSPNRRIQYQTIGVIPNRKWVVTYFEVPLFGCLDQYLNTQQIVLNEATGIIEVLIYSKEICNTWNEGRAMIGIQNATRDQAVMAPGRRASDAPWGARGRNEAWRFVPSSGNSLFLRAELYIAGNATPIATLNTPSGIAGNGNLELLFPNICPPAGATTTYVIKSVYEKYDDPNVEVAGYDTIRVTRSLATDLGATASATASSCGANGTGSITVAVPAGNGSGQFEYSISSATGPWQASNSFTDLLPGSYTAWVRDLNGSCGSAVPITVGTTGELQVSFTSTPTSCPGARNGSITLTTSGTSHTQYQINGSNWGSSNVITGLLNGSYFINVRDTSTGCVANNITVTVAAGNSPVTGTAASTPTSCAGLNNGTITVTPNGAGPFEYSLNGGNWQPSNTFNGLAPANYSVIIREGGVCTSAPINVTVNAGAGLNPTVTNTPTTCPGINNGTITVQFPAGTAAPYTVVLDGTTNIVNNNPVTFTGISAGTRTLRITDANGCATSNAISVNIGTGTGFTAVHTSTAVSCFGAADGVIDINIATPGTAPYNFVLNGTTTQTGTNGTQFTGLAAGNYSVLVTDAAGCSFTISSIDLASPPQLNATANVLPVSCSGSGNGQITLNATGGTPPYSYSIDNINFQSSSQFDLPAGSYDAYIRDARGCAFSLSGLTIIQPAPLQVQITSTTNATCAGGADGRVEVAASGGTAPYSYSADGGSSFQQDNILLLTPGNYTITVRDANGCETSSAAVNVGLTNTLSFIPMTDPLPICEGESVVLQTNSNATQFSWTPAISINDVNIASPEVSPATTTNYTVIYTLGQCTATDDVTVTVRPAPVANAGADATICAGQNYQLQGSGGISYSWSPAQYLSDSQLANPTVLSPAQSITYSLHVTDANNCRSLQPDQMVLTVTPPIQIQVLPSDTVVYPGAQFNLQAVSPATQYTWTPSSYLNNPQSDAPLFTAPAAGQEIQYRVSGTTDAGCQGEGFAIIRVYAGPELYVPNAFTPNGDGRNDLFFPFPVGVKSLEYFQVYNRWGQLLFSTRALGEGWDGRNAGQDQPAGVYIWQLKAVMEGDVEVKRQGTVVLIR